MNESTEAWFLQKTSTWRDWPLPQVSDSKGRRQATVSVVIPARNEERTVGGVVTAVRDELVRKVPLVDEVVVMDSDSTDATAEVAEQAGATVFRCRAPVRRRGTDGGDEHQGVTVSWELHG